MLLDWRTRRRVRILTGEPAAALSPKPQPSHTITWITTHYRPPSKYMITEAARLVAITAVPITIATAARRSTRTSQ
jgi:hypothetical protein